MKALTKSELAQSLNVKAGETKTFYFKNIVTFTGRYGGKYELQGVTITERVSEKTSAGFKYQFEYNGVTLTRWIEWDQVPAEIKKQAQKELGL